MASLESEAVESLYRDELRKSSNGHDSSVNGIPETPTIRVTVVQSGRHPKFNIVERTTWKGGAWNEHDSTRHNLTMTGTDVSGILRFKSEGSTPEFFLVALGVDFATPLPGLRIPRAEHSWCDLKVDLKSDDVAVLIHPKYYTPDTNEYRKRKEYHRTVHTTSHSGTVITVAYYDDGVNLPGISDDSVKLPGISDNSIDLSRIVGNRFKLRGVTITIA